MEHRDAFITSLRDKLLVITTDNSAGIGQREKDIFKADPQLIGALTARVALLEAVSLGAQPQILSSTLSFPFETEMGQAVIKGIKEEMKYFNIKETNLTGSSESNFPSPLTALGVTVISYAEETGLLINKLQNNDKIFLIGEPYVGDEVVANLNALPNFSTIRELFKINGLHEIIPCGSGGINSELHKLTENRSWFIDKLHDGSIDMKKSAGPASCLLVFGDLELQVLTARLKLPVNFVGILRRK